MVKTIEIVTSFPIIPLEVYVQFSLEQELTGVNIVEAEIPRVRLSVDYQTKYSSNFHRQKLLMRLRIRIEETGDSH